MRLAVSIFVVSFFAMTSAVFAAPEQSFAQFLRSFETKAVAAGIPKSVYRAATNGLTADPSIKVAQGTQPEFEKPIWDYLEKRVTADRIKRGRNAFAKNKALFERIGLAYGVDPYMLAAIWGVETDFGAIMNNDRYFKPVLRSLFSLVHQRRGRVALDEAELIAALRIVAQKEAPKGGLKGSWAGALGHLQIMPSAFLTHGTDFDGDGRRDPHNSLADALASSAKWLLGVKYQPGHDWGYEVQLPERFDYLLAGRTKLRPVSFFAGKGVSRVKGREFGDLNERVFLYVPAGANGPKFLMTQNYLALKGYNFADSYALAVAHLTDRIKGAGPFVKGWPKSAKFLNRQQRINLQTKLMKLGFYNDKLDGRFGPISQDALRAWQARNGKLADGFATIAVYNAVMKSN
ncbi:lytic murein transglycosylase [Maritalea sp.]|uniref:lytic murein transglycosylase n=1 Tax=Maritalea sp. TaxID=2003361 RepID=UPI003EF8E404